VFDNFEPVVAAAPLVARLLASCPWLTALVTSREPLRLSAEWVIAVPALTLSDPSRSTDDPLGSEAVRLFVERARATSANFTLTDANSHCVCEIVQRLDGLPLAIELAASRLAHLPPATLLRLLEHRLPILTGGARDLPERHRTLRGTIAWSYNLLTPEEQGVFRRMAVFVDGCTLEATEPIAAANSDLNSNVLDAIASLVSRSLMRQEEDRNGEPRFTMLETVREYGLEQLAASGEEPSVRDRHAMYFQKLVERADQAIWGGPDHSWWLDRLEPDLPNLRAALAWFDATDKHATLLRLAGTLGGLWHYRSHRVEGRDWIRRALVGDDGSDPFARAVAFYKLGILEHALGGPHPEVHIRKGMALRREANDRGGVGRGLMNLGNVLKDQGDYDQAMAVMEEACSILEPSGDIGGLATTRMYLGLTLLEQGDLVRAHAELTNALALHHQDGFMYGVASTLLALGRIAAERGDVAMAANHYAESLTLWTEVRSQEGLADAVAATATLAVTCNQPDVAARLLGAASAVGDALGYVAPPKTQKRYERAAQAARVALGEGQYAIAWKTGRLISLKQAAVEAEAALTIVNTGVAPDRDSVFTPREQDVLRLLVEGRSDREIAQALGIGYRTVTSYVRNILTKFDVTSRTAAATQAVRRGLV